MKQFDGFPARMQFTPVPNVFFSSLLAQIDDIAELKVTLHVLRMLYYKKGYPACVSFGELLSNPGLMDSLKNNGEPEEAVRRAIEMASKRGIFIQVVLDRDGQPENVYLLNTEKNREVAVKIQYGKVVLDGLRPVPQQSVEIKEQPGIFTLFEQNIGMLTPMIAEELREAVKLYPEDWIKDAIKEAVNQNKRKWSYISAILERWVAEGRDGTHFGDFEKSQAKYQRQKYGHVVKG